MLKFASLRCAMHGLLFFLLVSTGVLLPAAVGEARGKSDVLTFDNGDRLTCEIKQFESGIVQCSTAAMGTTNVEWVHIRGIHSPQYFRIRLANGYRYFGNLAGESPEGQLRIAHTGGVVDVPLRDVVAMSQVEAEFADRLDTSVSLGFSDYKSNGTTTVNLGFSVSYRDDYTTNSAEGRFITTKDRIETKDSARLDLTRLRDLSNPRNFISIGSTYESNDELAIDYRLSFAAGWGHRFIDNDRANLLVTLGAQVLTEEDSTGNETESVEGVASMNFKFWKFDSRDLDWSGSFQVYPGITESGRVRSDTNTQLRWEIFDDFYWNITAYASTDNKSGEEGSSSDYGITTGVEWKL